MSIKWGQKVAFLKFIGTLLKNMVAHQSVLKRDNAKKEQSEEKMKIYRKLFIEDQHIEPYNPQQNCVELRAIKYF